jgi:hypothetical protein
MRTFTPRFAPALLCCLALSAAGCEMRRPPIQSADAAWATYKGRVAEQCASKHPENMPSEKFHELALDYYRDADTQIQQLIDFDAKKACGTTGGTECFNTGFVQANVQAGSMEEFAKKVCSKS